MSSKPIIIVSGEPQSVFFEIFLKTLKKLNIKSFRNPLLLITSDKILYKNFRKFNANYNVNYVDERLHNLKIDKINLINIPYSKFSFNKKITTQSNLFIEKCFDTALRILKNNKCLGFINGPISKKTFLKGKFNGITEFLAAKTKTKDPVMLIFNKNLSVCPLTTHIPISKIEKKIKKIKIINKINNINFFYKNVFKKKPKIAITGLNPHCENFGGLNIERKEILPAINYLRKKKIDVKGPFAADTIFLEENIKKFDVILGMYHDQVLGPIKTIYGFKAINITIGLPFFRISPDHGPNEKMLGKNKSSPESLIESINFLTKYAK
tara:strand:+ start:306 stop:1277 length:972 start_codon:yes stop_codon:yes gene_type:complete